LKQHGYKIAGFLTGPARLLQRGMIDLVCGILVFKRVAKKNFGSDFSLLEFESHSTIWCFDGNMKGDL
jgi:hypothetical protein